MSGTHLLLLFLGVAAILGAALSYRRHLQTKQQERLAELRAQEIMALIEQLQQAGEQETQRVKLLLAARSR